MKRLLAKNGFYMLNKVLCRRLGVDAALMFAILVDGYDLFGDGFSQTIGQIEHLSFNFLHKRKQASALAMLCEAKIVEYRVYGLPKVRHFTLNAEKTKEIIGVEYNMNSIKNLLGQNSFFIVNKKLCKELSFEAALLLSIITDATIVFDSEWVYQTMPMVEEVSCGVLTRKKQERAIKLLIQEGILSQKNIGLPMKRHFKINADKLIDVLDRD